MKIYSEESLSNFKFWSGGADRANVLTQEQFDRVESTLEELYPDGCEDTMINDLFWFEEDTIAEWCGFKNFACLEKYNTEGESYDVKIVVDGGEPIYLAKKFDSQTEAESYCDNELDLTQYKAEYEDELNVYIVNNIDDDDEYEYMVFYKSDEEEDDE